MDWWHLGDHHGPVALEQTTSIQPDDGAAHSRANDDVHRHANLHEIHEPIVGRAIDQHQVGNQVK